MKTLYSFLFLILCFATSFAQISTKPDNYKRFGLDYTIKNVKIVSAEEATQISIDDYEHLRKDNEDVEVYDAKSKKTIVLFSKTKVIENERNSKAYSDYFQTLYIKEQ
jgi:hypothetical protein